MANITTYQHFTGNIQLPNTASTKALGEALGDFIKQREKQFLYEFFGVTLGQLIETDITTPSGNLPYTAIKAGANYTDVASDVQRWEGFAYNATTLVQSPIANYVYFHFMRYMETQTSGLGEVLQQVESGTRINAAPKLAKAWNDMVDMCWLLHGYLCSVKDTYAILDDYIGFKYAPMCGINSSNQKYFTKINAFSI